MEHAVSSSTEIAHRLTGGLVVERDDIEEASRVLGLIADEKDDVRRLEAALKDLVREWYATHGGPQTIRHHGVKIVVGPREETLYDHDVLETGLLAAGMPEAAVREIVTIEISYKVNATKAKQAAKANPKYAAAVEAATLVAEKIPSVTFSRERAAG